MLKVSGMSMLELLVVMTDANDAPTLALFTGLLGLKASLELLSEFGSG